MSNKTLNQKEVFLELRILLVFRKPFILILKLKDKYDFQLVIQRMF